MTLLAAAFMVVSLPTASAAASGRCSATAKTIFRSCGFDVLDEWWLAQAACINESEQADRDECNAEAGAARREGDEECSAQLDWRLAACDVLGEDRYDPPFDEELFDVDPAHPTHPNPYFPLAVGNRWDYRSTEETNTVVVVNATKLIDDVRCLVVHDTVFRNGVVHEDTNDWYAAAKDGTVWYCGEETKSFETFAGDSPQEPELVSIDGSFKAGVDGAKAGIIFLATPEVGAAYLEEFSLANAEDVTEVLSTTYAYGHDADLDESVPAALAQALCAGDCVVTKNYSLLEPGVVARKYYAPGIGVFLEVEPEGEPIVQLVSCNFDPRCNALPH